MKLCPQCEFIYEDDQKFCDMDGQELVHDPSSRAFTESLLPAATQLQGDVGAATILATLETPNRTRVSIPIPVAAGAAASRPANSPARWQPRGLAVAALAGLVLVALLFAVYYARTRQSQTPKANRFSSQSSSQSPGQSNAQSQTQSPTQSAASISAESATPTADTNAPGQALEQPSADQSANKADSAGLTPATSQPSSLPAGSEKAAPRDRQSANVIAARPSAENSRAPVIIRLTNGASIKADEAWEKRDGVWYRQAGMVTFLKRSRVKSIQRAASPTRGQTAPQAEKSLAQNQPRISKPETASPKKDSKVTSFLKTTGRILKKPFKL